MESNFPTRHTLSTGRLDLNITVGDAASLIEIAERRNPKRAFLFVSKVLGRHIPVRPIVHRRALIELAESAAPILDGEPALVMSYAETAIGLGLGVFDELRRLRPLDDIRYLPTTRHVPEGTDPWFEIREAHSHAVDHAILTPAGELMSAVRGGTLILVDDETTTGTTFRQLAVGLTNQGLSFSRIILVTLTDWSKWSTEEDLEDIFADIPIPVDRVSLARGSWNWEPDHAARKTPLPAPIAPGTPPWTPSPDARLGVPRRGATRATLLHDRRLVKEIVAEVEGRFGRADGPTAVIGTGEHVWQPFLAAEMLERRGADVDFIATTRSPVLPGSVIAHQITFPDHYGIGLTMYLNNIDPVRYERMLLFTETGGDGIPPQLTDRLGPVIVIDGNGSLHEIRGGRSP